MKQVIFKNLWLKLLALFLAILVWLYVVGELNKGTPEERALFERLLPYRLTAKEIPIKVAVVGKPRLGYQVLSEAISVRPLSCVILAPQNLLKNIDYLTTEDIDISEFTKSVTKEVRLKPVGGIILEKAIFVRVVIPIKKLKASEKEVGK